MRYAMNTVRNFTRKLRTDWAIYILGVSRAATIGVAYIMVRGIPGLTSSFVAIFVALLAFDLMIAAPSLKPRQIDIPALIKGTVQALNQTVRSLGKGLLLGIVFGTLKLIGVPETLGAVFTVGLGYTWANKVRGSFTGFVAVLGGLAVFDQIVKLDDTNSLRTILMHVGPVAWQVSFGTIIALLSGWLFGIPIGIVIRMILARPYRLKNSRAYDPPHEVRSFEDVVQPAQNHRLIQLVIEEHSELDGKQLADLDWPAMYGATVVTIERENTSISLPRGSETLHIGDSMLVLCPSEYVDILAAMSKRQLKDVKV